MWYLNDIVCLNSTCLYSFILTMWYLNSNDIIDSVVKANSFILTMWYLNSDEYEEKDNDMKRFI